MIILMLAAVLTYQDAAPANHALRPMWQNVEAGMTVDQVRALYPNARVRRDKIEIRDYRPMPNCPSTVVITMAPVVTKIEVRGAGSLTGGCSEEIGHALIERYGQPVDEEYESNYFMGATAPVTSYFWIVEGVAMRFERREDQGLMFPSWTMTYIPESVIDAERQRLRGVGL